MRYYVWRRLHPGLAWLVSTGEGTEALARAQEFAIGWAAKGYEVAIHDSMGLLIDLGGFTDGAGI